MCYNNINLVLSSEMSFTLLAVKAREQYANSVEFRSQQIVWTGEESFHSLRLDAFFSFYLPRSDHIKECYASSNQTLLF